MAIVKCKECKKEVSDKAKVCPHCGVKDPARYPMSIKQQTVGAIVLFAVIGIGIHSCSSDSGDDKTASAKKSPCAASDSQCIFDQNWIDAASPCKRLVEKAAKYDFEWLDGFTKPLFSHYKYQPNVHSIVFIGDSLRFTNGFNAKVPMIYECTYDLQSKSVTNFDVVEGKL